MGLRRKAAVVVVVPIALVTALSVGPASAGGNGFKGNAVGNVTCTGIAIKLRFSFPSATTHITGGSPTFSGKVTGCTVSNTPAGVTETIAQGRVHTGFIDQIETTSGCVDLGPYANIQIQFVWQGTYKDATHSGKASFTSTVVDLQGAQLAQDGSGNLGLEIPRPGSTGMAMGSFAGPVTNESFLYTSESTTAINNICASKHGLSKITFTHGGVGYP